MATLPFYKTEFSDYLEYAEQLKVGVVDPKRKPAMFEYSELVAKKGSRMTLAGPQETITWVDYDGREAFVDTGSKLVPGKELSRANVATMFEHAIAKWGPDGVNVSGSATFKKLVFELAYERNMELKDPQFLAYAEHMNKDRERVGTLAEREKKPSDHERDGHDDMNHDPFGHDGYDN